jgi:hypothetical protein
MLLLVGIASAWCICCTMAVALCVMASRGDRALEKAMTNVPAPETPEIAWVATLAEPQPQPVAARQRAAARTR